MRYLKWFFSLPIIRKSVGVLDRYNRGKVHHIDFNGECTVVWVGYKTKSKAYRC